MVRSPLPNFIIMAPLASVSPSYAASQYAKAPLQRGDQGGFGVTSFSTFVFFISPLAALQKKY